MPDYNRDEQDFLDKLEAMLAGGAQGATFGFADEIEAGLDTAGKYLTGQPYDYAAKKKAILDRNAGLQSMQPTAYMAGDIGGSLAMPLPVLGGAAAAMKAGKAAGTAAKAAGKGASELAGKSMLKEGVKNVGTNIAPAVTSAIGRDDYEGLASPGMGMAVLGGLGSPMMKAAGKGGKAAGKTKLPKSKGTSNLTREQLESITPDDIQDFRDMKSKGLSQDEMREFFTGKSANASKTSSIDTFIDKQLKDLGVSKGSRAYETIFENAKAGSDVMSKKQLKKYIEEYLDNLPDTYLASPSKYVGKNTEIRSSLENLSPEQYQSLKEGAEAALRASASRGEVDQTLMDIVHAFRAFETGDHDTFDRTVNALKKFM